MGWRPAWAHGEATEREAEETLFLHIRLRLAVGQPWVSKQFARDGAEDYLKEPVASARFKRELRTVKLPVPSRMVIIQGRETRSHPVTSQAQPGVRHGR